MAGLTELLFRLSFTTLVFNHLNIILSAAYRSAVNETTNRYFAPLIMINVKLHCSKRRHQEEKGKTISNAIDNRVVMISSTSRIQT